MNPINNDQHPGTDPQPTHPLPPIQPTPPPQYQVGHVIPSIQPASPPPTIPASAMKFGPKDWIKLILGLLVVVAIIATISFWIGKTPGAVKADIRKNGLQATAISTGRAFVFNERQSKYTRKMTYRANYTYTAADGKEYDVHGDKDYESEANVAAKEGMKAEIRYDPEDPYHPVFITEE